MNALTEEEVAAQRAKQEFLMHQNEFQEQLTSEDGIKGLNDQQNFGSRQFASPDFAMRKGMKEESNYFFDDSPSSRSPSSAESEGRRGRGMGRGFRPRDYSKQVGTNTAAPSLPIVGGLNNQVELNYFQSSLLFLFVIIFVCTVFSFLFVLFLIIFKN